MRILIAEHDASLGAFLEKEFASAKIAADLAAERDQIRYALTTQSYDAAVLDIDSANEHELGILRDVRRLHEQLPLLVLAAGDGASQRALAVDLGAADVLLKPFEFSELLARVRALTRRRNHQGEEVLRIDNLELSRADHVVMRAGRKIRLTPKEFALLECLLAKAGQCVTRSEIVRHVWHHSSDPLTNIVDVYVNYLRKKVDVPFESKLIHTVRGVGYQLQALNSSGGKAA